MPSVIDAVMERDLEALQAALAAGQSPEAVDDTGHPALVVATGSTQFRAANMLLDAGANIWTVDPFGNTPANFAVIGDLVPGSPESLARDQFIARLKHAGYPWPPPRAPEVRAMLKAHRWPPASVKH